MTSGLPAYAPSEEHELLRQTVRDLAEAKIAPAAAVPGTQAEEMHRCKSRGFCCGAGGARMWMEERTGKRINTERIDEALALKPDTVSTACPYCLVMLGDAVAAKKGSGEAKDSLEVIDVAQLLARSVTRNGATAADAAAVDGEAKR
jgi:Fe-S oxidoreductase